MRSVCEGAIVDRRFELIEHTLRHKGLLRMVMEVELRVGDAEKGLGCNTLDNK